MESTTVQARKANAVDIWDKLWSEEGEDSWRRQAMGRTYNRIGSLLGDTDGTGPGSSVFDLGGGVGFLAEKLQIRGYGVEVIDHSKAAVKACIAKGIIAHEKDLVAAPTDWTLREGGVVVATEVIEHFDDAVRHELLTKIAEGSSKAFLSVPNNRLGPDEEPQHAIKWTAKQFKDYLETFWKKGHVRVEVLGPYLLGVCSREPKGFTLSVCFPAKDEAADIEACLASYRGVADQMVIGVDPRSSDRTYEIACEYADVVFIITDPEGKSQPDPAPDGGVHFAHIRNQCAEHCTSEWIFMTEAHERLLTGEDTLLALDILVPEKAQVGFVFRNGGHNGRRERWAFPWLYRNNGVASFKRNTHNVLDYPEGTYCIRLPQVNTLHERHDDATKARATQRKVQNRLTLLDDWMQNDNSNSLFYLAQELRGIDTLNDDRAIARFEQFLATANGNGEARYQSRLMLCKLHIAAGDRKAARETLMGCIRDDWSRTEHWIWLGDLAYEDGQFEQAYQFYMYAGTRIGEPPFTLWWIDLSMYSYIPAQRLAMVSADLGRIPDSLHWATRVLSLLPDDAHAEAFEEAEANITLLKGLIS